MRRSDGTWSPSLVASLTLHVIVALALVLQFSRDMQAHLERGLPPLRRAVVQIERDLTNPWGEMDGKGLALDSSPGDLPMISPNKGPQDQAALSRNPGRPGEMPLEPSLASAMRPDAPRGALPEDQEPPLLAGLTQVNAPQPSVKPATRPAMASASADSATPVRASAGSSGSSGDPYPQADQDSDPFSSGSYATIGRSGRLDARFGRKAKIVRPILTNKGEIDVLTYPDPAVVLRIRTDSTGKVVDVSWPPLKSSGSNEIDTPVYVAAWKWWFEPPKGADGQPRADAFRFGVTWSR